MKNLSVVGASALALGVALGSHAALATPFGRAVTANIADYNAAQVKASADIVTVPDGLATYNAGTGTLEVNSRFTVTLPAGFSFSSQPALTVTPGTQLVLEAGGIGAQSITYTVTGAPVIGGQLTLTSFAVQGVSALETPIPVAAALPITMQSTNNSQVNNNDLKPLSAPAFASEPGMDSTATENFGEIGFIDLTSPSLGTQFVSFVTEADTATAALFELSWFAQTADRATHSVPVLSADGLGNTLASSDTATITIAGAFNGIATAFLSDDACADALTGVTATVTPGQITLAGAPQGGPHVFCVTADGTTLLQQNLGENGLGVTIAPGSSTDFLAAALDSEPVGFTTYVGGGVISVTNFFTGDDSGYSSLLRVNNAGTSDTNIFALVQPDTGGAPLTGSLGVIGAGSGTVFSEAAVEAAVSGLSLANSGQRATLQLIVSGVDFTQVKASSLLVNPGGVVDNVGTNAGTGHIEE